ncbi:MAG: TRAP transporter small permease [Clostridiales bacterium]|nr:TRAP transporter small permease [Clostridiales bacterium]
MAWINKWLDGFVTVVKWLLMVSVFSLAALICAELLIRNLLNKSFSPTIEICSILFIWMAFLGVIYLYHHSGLMRFEILVRKVGPGMRLVFWYLNKATSLMLGVILVIAFVQWYPFISTRYFATMQFLPFTVQCVPIAICGVYLVVKTLCQLIEQTTALVKGKEAPVC